MSTVLGDLDFQVMDDTETVKYTSGTTTVSGITNCWHTPISRRETMTSNGAFTGQEEVWHMPVALLSVADPREGDFITDSAGVKWQVNELRKEVGGTDWRFVTTRGRA